MTYTDIMTIQVLNSIFTLHKLKNSDIHLAEYSGYQFFSITTDEISYIADRELDDILCIQKETWWRCLKLIGTFEFSENNIGITAKLSSILASVGISLCFIGTHDTDYILIKDQDLKKSISALKDSWIGIIR